MARISHGVLPIVLMTLVAGPAAPTHVEAMLSDPPSNVYPGGALDRDCSHTADGLGGPGYQFLTSCPGRSISPDRRFAVVQSAEQGQSVTLVDADGNLLDEIPNLRDAMPFVLFWSPRSDWFFVNHYQGSTMERLRVFEIVNRQVVERSSIYAEATRIAVARYPCLGRTGAVYASGWSWSRDGRRVALVAYAHPAACPERDGGDRPAVGDPPESLWMIGDAETGRIDPQSVRVRPGGVGPLPTDGPYAALCRDTRETGCP